jgi:hypothetical protein
MRATLTDGTPIVIDKNAGRIDADAGNEHAGHQIFEVHYPDAGGLDFIACECSILIKRPPTRDERLFRTMIVLVVVAGIVAAILLKNFDWYTDI